MSDECPICDAAGYKSAGTRLVCEECGHYNESYHHGSEAKRRARERREDQREWERDAHIGGSWL